MVLPVDWLNMVVVAAADILMFQLTVREVQVSLEAVVVVAEVVQRLHRH